MDFLLSTLDITIAILKVAVGLGMVIFVHELGHFLVAKACGVKCEKFYIGFDIAGLRFWRHRWGETEYGIGILPLGGYVKMLGQEDNPARLREEMERARQGDEAGSGDTDAADADAPPAGTDAEKAAAKRAEPQAEAKRGESQAEAEKAGREEPGPPDDSVAAGGAGADPAAPSGQAAAAAGEGSEAEHAREALYDPRSYLAKSVPQRMAIISAGVAMNVLFAALVGAWAFGLGVRQLACGVGGLTPGDPAWAAGLEVGDTIVAINDQPAERFQDLRTNIALGAVNDGVRLTVVRPGVEEPLEFQLVPERGALLRTIGVTPPLTPTVNTFGPPVEPATPAAEAEPAFEAGDRIVEIDGAAVAHFADVHRLFAENPSRSMEVVVERPAEDALAGEPGKWIAVKLAPRPKRSLGIVMEMGPVTAVRAGSPAAAAGIERGDTVVAVDGRPMALEGADAPVVDPLRLPDELRSLAGQTVVFLVRRPGATEPLEIPVTLDEVTRFDRDRLRTSPMTVPAAGFAYEVRPRVQHVDPEGPAAATGIRPGDEVARVSFLPLDEAARDALRERYGDPSLHQRQEDVDLETNSWVFVHHLAQSVLPGTQVAVELADEREATFTPEPADGWFNPDRGILFEPAHFIQKAAGVGEALRLGLEETGEAMLLVVRMLQRVGTRDVSPRAFGGPVTIAQFAYYAATEGLPTLLLFLTLLSANLAVINFLPIPLLDGGHMVFLIWEGVTGKPPDERVHAILSYLGLLIILTLMIWVFGLDFGLIARE